CLPPLEVERIWICLLSDETETTPLDLELIDCLITKPGDEDFPDARACVMAHWMPSAVPLIEVADDADSFRIRRPYRKVPAAYAVDHPQMRTELFIVAIMSALGHQMQIVIR